MKEEERDGGGERMIMREMEEGDREGRMRERKIHGRGDENEGVMDEV